MARYEMEKTARGHDVTQNVRGSMAKLHPDALDEFLGDVHLPADREQLIMHARRNDAPDEVIHALGQIEQRQYGDWEQVKEAIRMAD